MALLVNARRGIIYFSILILLAACAPESPQVSVTPTTELTSLPTHTPRRTATPRPTRTETLPVDTLAPDGSVTGTSEAATQPANVNPPGNNVAPDKYQYLGQDIPDRSQFLPNRVVTITWTVKNDGTTGWTKDYTLRYFSGPTPTKEVYPFSKEVPAGGTINFVVTFTTPAITGDYDLWFKMTNAAGQNFGDLDLVFTVTNSPVRGTSTPAN